MWTDGEQRISHYQEAANGVLRAIREGSWAEFSKKNSTFDLNLNTHPAYAFCPPPGFDGSRWSAALPPWPAASEDR